MHLLKDKDINVCKLPSLRFLKMPAFLAYLFCTDYFRISQVVDAGQSLEEVHKEMLNHAKGAMMNCGNTSVKKLWIED